VNTSKQLTESLSNWLNEDRSSDYSSSYSKLVEKVLLHSKPSYLEFLPRTSSLSFYEGLVAVRKNSRSVLKKLKGTFSKSDTDFNKIIEYLNSSTSEELKSIYGEYNTEKNNQKILFLIQVFIAKKEAIEWLSKFKKFDVIYTSFGVEILLFKRNVKFFFRKILSIHFKNLEDYHSYSIL
jgi:hypothetical protein